MNLYVECAVRSAYRLPIEAKATESCSILNRLCTKVHPVALMTDRVFEIAVVVLGVFYAPLHRSDLQVTIS